jgi:hypothetical protein
MGYETSLLTDYLPLFVMNPDRMVIQVGFFFLVEFIKAPAVI